MVSIKQKSIFALRKLKNNDIVNTLSYKTVSIRKEDVQRAWYIVDAEGAVLGRMSTKIATVLRGKHKPSYTPHIDCGDYVIVINADKIKLTGNKMKDKKYYTHSGYPGGQKVTNPERLLQKKPFAVVEKAVKGMLPKTKLGRKMYKKMFVYAGSDHPHQAQQPQTLEV